MKKAKIKRIARYIFTRFRRVRNSNRVLDAWDYGYKAWRIPVWH